MANQVEIVNLALNHLGESDFILSMNENIKSARVANLVWNTAKEKVLSDHPWKFALKRASLASLVDVPVYEYTNQFQLPSDFLHLVELSDSDKPIQDFEINGTYILCDESIVYLKYVYDVVNTDLFSASFVDCFSLFLAHKMCNNITGNRNKTNELFDLYTRELSIAKENDATQASPKGYINDDLWTDKVRDGGGLIY